MSVTTSARLNVDQLVAALPAGATVKTEGADPTVAAAKTITATGCTDAQLQTAITTATGQFVDRVANAAALVTKAQAALTANTTFIAAAKPGTAATQASAAYDQTVALSKAVNGIIRQLLNLFDSTAGT